MYSFKLFEISTPQTKFTATEITDNIILSRLQTNIDRLFFTRQKGQFVMIGIMVDPIVEA